MRYFRDYTWGSQLLLFFLLTICLFSVAGIVVPSVLPKLTGYSYNDLIEGISMATPYPAVQASLILEGLLSFFCIFLPAFLFAYLSHPEPSGYLGLRRPGKPIQWLLSILVIIGAIPVLEFIGTLMSLIDFGPEIKAKQLKFEEMENAYLNMPNFISFLRALVFMAIVPAIGEEMYFRGVLLRLAKKRSAKMAAPVMATAAIFASMHFNIYGLPSIFLAGCLLASIYYLTGSLWCSIVSHLVFNSLQIVAIYFSNSAAAKTAAANDAMPVWMVLGGAVLFGFSLYLLVKNSTPLPADWTNDFEKQKLPQFDYGENNENK